MDHPLSGAYPLSSVCGDLECNVYFYYTSSIIFSGFFLEHLVIKIIHFRKFFLSFSSDLILEEVLL